MPEQLNEYSFSRSFFDRVVLISISEIQPFESNMIHPDICLDSGIVKGLLKGSLAYLWQITVTVHCLGVFFGEFFNITATVMAVLLNKGKTTPKHLHLPH